MQELLIILAYQHMKFLGFSHDLLFWNVMGTLISLTIVCLFSLLKIGKVISWLWINVFLPLLFMCILILYVDYRLNRLDIVYIASIFKAYTLDNS